jgi:hypothetical protein
MKRRFLFLYQGVLSSSTRRVTTGSAAAPTLTIFAMIGYLAKKWRVASISIIQVDEVRPTPGDCVRGPNANANGKNIGNKKVALHLFNFECLESDHVIPHCLKGIHICISVLLRKSCAPMQHPARFMCFLPYSPKSKCHVCSLLMCGRQQIADSMLHTSGVFALVAATP